MRIKKYIIDNQLLMLYTVPLQNKKTLKANAIKVFKIYNVAQAGFSMILIVNKLK